MNDHHKPFGECCKDRVPLAGERLIEFDNIYEDGTEVKVRHCVPLLTEEQFAVLSPAERLGLVEDNPCPTYEDYQREELWLWTGTGKCEGDAGYFATSVDGLQPAIEEEWC